MKALIIALVVTVSTFNNLNLSAKEQDYRVYDSAKEYGMAWGCRGMKVDFNRFDYNESYRNQTINNCTVENYIVNLYENRIVQTTVTEYYPNRAYTMNHHSKSISELKGVEVINYSGQAEGYALWEGYKWSGSETIMLSLLPWSEAGKSAVSEIVTCNNCTENARLLGTNMLGWSASRLDSLAWTSEFSYFYDDKNYSSYIIGKFSGEVPKREGYAMIKAAYQITFDYNTKQFAVKLIKILESKIEDL